MINHLIIILAIVGVLFILNNILKFVRNFHKHYELLKELEQDGVIWKLRNKITDLEYSVRMLQNWRKEVEKYFNEMPVVRKKENK